MDTSQRSPPASATDGKKRFKPKQLERKRLVDRLAQRRTRKQLKDHVADLENRVGMLARGEHEALIRHITRENDKLRASLNRYKCKMEAVLLCTKECLDEEEDDISNPDPQMVHSQPSASRNQSPWPTADSPSQHHSASAFPIVTVSQTWKSSIVFQAASLVLPGAKGSGSVPFTRREWLECIAMWKIAYSRGQESSFLLRHFDLDKNPISLTTGTFLTMTPIVWEPVELTSCGIQNNSTGLPWCLTSISMFSTASSREKTYPSCRIGGRRPKILSTSVP